MYPPLSSLASILAYQKSKSPKYDSSIGYYFSWKYGWRINPAIDPPTRLFHNGVDLPATTGTPIYAPFDGKVIKKFTDDTSGNALRISHYDPDYPEVRETAYAHLSSFASGIEVGSVVKQGDVIGYVGSTGRSTGAHLHFIIRTDSHLVDGVSRTEVDPLPYLETSIGQKKVEGAATLATMLLGSFLIYWILQKM